ncbi:amino acid [Plasmopara halstedii]|uniref:Amino acid n=1 Tax=Plasmopara halstedii TaxID=4781 RepID=A0A0P1AAB1_PLAHL|nr:amino acid [Plasmopara halstedii]CEG37354.1 amino acid [Plasmopara halstedii]|eukprot:XP_024573723.1 amino acid [Plasmopara halstedii]
MATTEHTHLLIHSDLCEDGSTSIKPYGPGVTLAMALNYVIGTGCFGLPYAFMEGGIFLAFTLMIVGVLGSMITMNYTLESLARAEGVCAATNGVAPKHQITYRKFEFATIAEMFVGNMGKVAVQLVMGLYCIGSLWSYASVFSSSTASIFFNYVLNESCDVYGVDPSAGCLNGYYVFMAIFSVLVLSMVLMDISDQALVQKFLSVYRVVAFALMLVTMTVKVTSDGSDVVASRYTLIGPVNWRNFGKAFGPTLLALNCQYNMPDALQPLNPKSSVRFVAFAALLLAGTCYLLVGLLGALSFDTINPLATLMWSSYTGCGNGWEECEYFNPLGLIVQLVILLFPVINVVSAYPMVGVTVGDNMLMSFPSHLTERFGRKFTRSLCRLLVAAPPILFAVVFKRLDFIFSIAGLFGFLLGLTIPCWFQVIGSRYCQQVWGFPSAATTEYTEPIVSSIPFASGFLALTFVITAVAIGTLSA